MLQNSKKSTDKFQFFIGSYLFYKQNTFLKYYIEVISNCFVCEQDESDSTRWQTNFFKILVSSAFAAEIIAGHLTTLNVRSSCSVLFLLPEYVTRKLCFVKLQNYVVYRFGN